MENIFEPAFGNRPDCIVGRDDVLHTIDNALKTRPGSRDRALFIIGQRGMGKTALLLETETQAKKSGFVTARATSNESMLDVLLENLQINGRKFVKDSKKNIQGMSAGAFGFSFGLTFSQEVQEHYGFQNKLSLLCDRLNAHSKKVLLLVDEIRASSREMRELAGAYQQLVGDGKDIAICMAGLPSAISSVLNDSVLTFLNRSSKIHLAPLPFASIRPYYAATFERIGLSCPAEVLNHAVEETGGFPYLLQLIGYYLVEESRSCAAATKESLSRALADARNDMQDNVFHPTLKALSRKDVAFLVALAEAIKEEGSGSISSVARIMGKENNYIQVYRRRLIDAEVISSPQNGLLEFSIPFLSDYLIHRYGEKSYVLRR